jgi:hypothetical protein
MLSTIDMGDPFDELSLSPRTPPTPGSRGRGLPVPPVIPLVAILSILVGLSVGYGFAPKSDLAKSPNPPSPSPRLVAFESAKASAGPALVSSEPSGNAEIPPPGGLNLAQALEALGVSFGPPAYVISARAGHYPAVSQGWVWIMVVPYSTVDCRARADPPMACRWISTTELIILDYETGELLEDRVPAG